jgi:hypothetical protein
VRRRRPRISSDRHQDHYCGDAHLRRSAHLRSADTRHNGDAHLRRSVHNGGRGDFRASFDRARFYDAGIDR